MRLALALFMFMLGIIVTYADLTPRLTGLFDSLGMILMITGAIQIAFIVGANLFPHTPPALEPMFRNEKLVLWLAAPLVAVFAVMIQIMSRLI